MIKNYWIDKINPLAAAIRDWRKHKSQKDSDFINKTFREIAVDIAQADARNRWDSKSSDEILKDHRFTLLIKRAWERVAKFDMDKRDKALQYFTNAMKYDFRQQEDCGCYDKTAVRQIRPNPTTTAAYRARRTAILRHLGNPTNKP